MDSHAAAVTAEPASSPLMLLARAANEGDLVATQKLLVAITPRVIRIVRAVLGAAHPDLDDVVQQALIGFTQSLRNFRGECEPTTFATQIAVRAALANARRQRVARARHESDVDLDAIPTIAPQLEASVDTQRLRAALRELMSRIPEEQAEAIAMRIVLGWSLEEIARMTKAPANTVRSRIRLAKQALRTQIARDPALAALLGCDD